MGRRGDEARQFDGCLTMNEEARIEVIAAALADQSRSRIVFALMDGRAYTAKELAYQGRITAQTASFHLQKLVDAGIISRHSQGRHRYHHLANEDIAAAIEALSVAAPRAHLRRLKPGAEGEIRMARSCYDHLAGRLGVAVAGRVIKMDVLVASEEGFALTEQGRRVLTEMGVNPHHVVPGRKPLAQQCMDWTERKFHFSGVLGQVLLEHFLTTGWLARARDSRVLTITAKGAALFRDRLGVAVNELEAPRLVA